MQNYGMPVLNKLKVARVFLEPGFSFAYLANQIPSDIIPTALKPSHRESYLYI